MKKLFKKKTQEAAASNTENLSDEETFENEDNGRKNKRKSADQDKYTPQRLKKRKLSGKELAILIIPALCAVAAAAVVMTTVDHGNKYELPADGYQYYAGNSAKIPKGTELKIKTPEDKNEEQDIPIYIEGKNEMVLPMETIYYTPRSDKYGRLLQFSEVKTSSGGAVTVTHEGKSARTEKGFLFDGNNTYIFLEPMTIRFNNYSVNVSPLSYAEAVYGGNIMIFDYADKKFYVEPTDGFAFAKSPEGEYEISLLGDSVKLYDGSMLLLATRPELFDSVF